MSSQKYKSGHHLPRVKKAANVRLGTYIVLTVLCDRSEFDRPEVTITKAQIAAISGLCMKTIKKSLQHLREIGAIVPIKNAVGGRTNATTYRLEVIGQGGEDQSQSERGGRECPAELFSEWHKRHGMIEAISRKRRYEAGEDIGPE